MPTSAKDRETTPVANDPMAPAANDSKDHIVDALASEADTTLRIGDDNKPESEGDGSTTLNVAKVAGKIPYTMFPHIVEDMMRYTSASTLLSFRATCKKLRDLADGIFGAHLEVFMDGTSLIMEAPGRQVTKGQRIPAMMNRGPFKIGADFANVGSREPEDVWFQVPRKDAEWFKAFLGGVEVVDLHGPMEYTEILFVDRNNFDTKDAFATVAVEAVKVPTVRYLAGPSSMDDTGLGYPAACPFFADTTVHFMVETRPNVDIRSTYLFTHPYIPRSTKHLVINLWLNTQQNWPSVMLNPLVYPDGLESAMIIFFIEDDHTDNPSMAEDAAPLSPGNIGEGMLWQIIATIFFNYRPGIKWTLANVGSMVLPKTTPGRFTAWDLICPILSTIVEALQASEPFADGNHLIRRPSPNFTIAHEIPDISADLFQLLPWPSSTGHPSRWVDFVN